MRSVRLFLWMLVAFAVVLGACTPKQAPAPAPSPVPAAPQEATAAPTLVAPAKSPEDAAWDKVVQAAKKEGKLTLYAYSFIGDAGLALNKAFKDRYGIDVEIVTGRGAEFVERLKIEKRMGRVTADAYEGSPTTTGNLKSLSLLTSFKGELPILKQTGVWTLDPLAIDPDGYYLAYFRVLYITLINTTMVKPGEEPKSWYDILEPRWKGKLLFQDPRMSASAYRFMVLIENGLLTKDFYERLAKQEPVLILGGREGAERIARGEQPLALSLPQIDVLPFAAAGAPIKAIDMKEGATILFMAIGSVAGGPHPNAMRLLMNWLLSEEGQMYTSKYLGPPLRKGIPQFIPESVRLEQSNPVIITNEQIAKMDQAFRDRTLVPMFIK